MKGPTQKTLERISVFKYQLILEGIATGFFTGLVVALFRLALTKADIIRDAVITMAEQKVLIGIMAFFILFFIVTVVNFCLRKEPLCSGSGIPQVKGEIKGQIEADWLQVIICKFIGGIAAIGGGLSLGREGPSIQLGAMVGKGFSRITKRLRTEEKLLMTCGAGAGLAAAFSAPLAGVVFTLEELHKNFSTEVLLSTMGAAVTSDFVSSYIFGLNPVFQFAIDGRLPLSRYWMVILLGIILGGFGVFYNFVIDKMQNLFSNIKPGFLRTALPFILVIILAVFYPRVLGSGHHLVGEVAAGNMVLGALALLLALKFTFSVISFGSGAPGGIFLPLLVLGAVTGGLFARAMGLITGYEEVYMANFVIIGMTGYFSAIVRAPITGVILITEMTGDFTNFLSLAVVAFVSYITADILKGKPVYEQLLDKMLNKKNDAQSSRSGRHKVIIESEVYYGSKMDGSPMSVMILPPGCLVVSVIRGGKEIVPNGSTVLTGGDRLTVLCSEASISVAEKRLKETCKTIVNA